MPKKTFKRKKAFQAFCRTQVVKEGLINHADGLWRKAELGKAMDRMQRDGYRVR